MNLPTSSLLRPLSENLIEKPPQEKQYFPTIQVRIYNNIIYGGRFMPCIHLFINVSSSLQTMVFDDVQQHSLKLIVVFN